MGRGGARKGAGRKKGSFKLSPWRQKHIAERYAVLRKKHFETVAHEKLLDLYDMQEQLRTDSESPLGEIYAVPANAIYMGYSARLVMLRMAEDNCWINDEVDPSELAAQMNHAAIALRERREIISELGALSQTVEVRDNYRDKLIEQVAEEVTETFKMLARGNKAIGLPPYDTTITPIMVKSCLQKFPAPIKYV